jgi:hypothetical protein
MPRPHRNPFYALLGIVGFLFAITASSYCVFVLRGIRPESRAAAPHAFERLMDRHGTALLAGQLAVLAVATFGAVAVDHVAGERERKAREAAARDRDARRAAAPATTAGNDRP